MKGPRYINGYRLIYRPDHFSAMHNCKWEGYVYEHRYVVECRLGRKLYWYEEVHHLDGNKANNDPSNLIVLSRQDHAKIHYWMDCGAIISPEYKGHKSIREKSLRGIERYCKCCGQPLKDKQQIYCSRECAQQDHTNPNKPSKEQLYEDMQTMSWLAIGRKYSVSDNGARKWARSYGLPIATRPYYRS